MITKPDFPQPVDKPPSRPPLRAPAAPPHSREQFEQTLWELLTGPGSGELTARQIIDTVLAAHDAAVSAASRRAVLDAALGLIDDAPKPAIVPPGGTVHWLATALRTGCGITMRNRPPGFAATTRRLVTCQRPGCATPVNPEGHPS